MAETFDVLASESGFESTGPTSGHEIEEVTARAKPSGVVFTVRVPPILMNAEAIDGLLVAQADYYNTISTWPHVDSIAELRTFGANDEIVDHLQIVVSSSSGRLTRTLDSQRFTAGLPQLRAEIDGVAAELDAIEAL